MNKIEILMRSPLFQGIEPGQLEEILSCLGAKTVFFRKDDFIVRTGESITHVGMVVSGKAVVMKEDEYGNRSILAEIPPAEIFGEAFACTETEKSTVLVAAAEDCEILHINYRKMTSSCSSACAFHARLIRNMLSLLAGKVLLLNRKIEILSKRTIREKLTAFLEMQRERAGADSFTLSLNREELADYLFVDRSAMSRELGKMRDEGLIAFKKNQFTIK